jgi:putative redox protein
MTDKSKELGSTIKLVNDKLQFVGIVGDNAPISIDYIAPLGDDQGYTSLELLLLSLSSCIGSAVLTLLRKMRKTIVMCEIQATGLRKEEHPTGFKSIHMQIDLRSKDVTEEDMKKVIDMAEEKYCPVWAMIKGNTLVEIDFKITEPSNTLA